MLKIGVFAIEGRIGLFIRIDDDMGLSKWFDQSGQF